jgi:hypothetical protein
MLAAPMPVQFIGNKSQKLAELTCSFSGFPALGTAMSPEYFPFISGPGSAKPSTGGVVRLKNVSSPLTHSAYFVLILLDPLFYQKI